MLACSTTSIPGAVAGSSSNEKPVGEVGGNRVVVGGFHLHDDRQILRDGSTDTCNHADSLQHATARRNFPDREPYRSSQIIQDTARSRLLGCHRDSSSSTIIENRARVTVDGAISPRCFAAFVSRYLWPSVRVFTGGEPASQNEKLDDNCRSAVIRRR